MVMAWLQLQKLQSQQVLIGWERHYWKRPSHYEMAE
jgi:hypothetical protein